jgi:hypothetical protein
MEINKEGRLSNNQKPIKGEVQPFLLLTMRLGFVTFGSHATNTSNSVSRNIAFDECLVNSFCLTVLSVNLWYNVHRQLKVASPATNRLDP